MSANKKVALDILTTLRKKGFQAYFAGGCVRDMILKSEAQDYDIATDAVPDTIEKTFAKTVLVGKQFGVVKVIQENTTVEVTTFRSEGAYEDGRRPSFVKFSTSPEEDVKRRDFTVNGLMYDPLEKKVLDFVGGQNDIKKKIIRTIGDPYTRLNEDKLRLIRAVRFASKLGFQMDETTLKAVKDLADKITVVSWERIQDEFRKIITDKNRIRAITLLDETGLLKQILPEFEQMKGVRQPPQHHPEGDVWIHTLLTLEKLASHDFDVSFSALLHDVGKPKASNVVDGKITFYRHEQIGEQMSEEICKRFKLSVKETEVIKYIVKSHLKFKDVNSMKISTLKRFINEEHFTKLRLVAEADTAASNQDFSFFEFVDEFLEKYKSEEMKPPPLITGNDLIKIGFKPSPLFSEILKDVYDRQLENDIKTRDEALVYINSKYKGK